MSHYRSWKRPGFGGPKTTELQAWHRKERQAAEAAVAAWNESVSVGALVEYRDGGTGEPLRMRTTSPAKNSDWNITSVDVDVYPFHVQIAWCTPVKEDSP